MISYCRKFRYATSHNVDYAINRKKVRMSVSIINLFLYYYKSWCFLRLNMKNRDLSFLDYMDKTQIMRIFY